LKDDQLQSISVFPRWSLNISLVHSPFELHASHLSFAVNMYQDSLLAIYQVIVFVDKTCTAVWTMHWNLVDSRRGASWESIYVSQQVWLVIVTSWLTS